MTEREMQHYEDAFGLAFELIDALGLDGAERFAREHAADPIALRALDAAMDDHGMPRPEAA